MDLNVQVKVEPGEMLDEAVNSKEYTCLYKNHVIKDELVIGPEMVLGDVATKSTNKTSKHNFNVKVKTEKCDKPTGDTKPKVIVDVKIERQDSTEECDEIENVKPKPNKVKSKRKSKPNQQLSCELCHKQFTFKSNLHRHMKVHKTGKKYTCDLCDRKFIAKWNLTQHLRSHSNLKYECKICHESIADHSRYKNHIRQHYGVFKKPKNLEANVETKLTCDICKKTYLSRKSIVRHIQEHYEFNRFLCHVCSKSFSRQENLNMHLYRHENITFSCAICKKKFLREGTAKIHPKKCQVNVVIR